MNVTEDVSGADGGRKYFRTGETRKTFNILVNSDLEPERDEHLVIELSAAQGGANIDSSKNKVTLVISANDGVGGQIGFSPGSRSRNVMEGGTVSFDIYRTPPAAGHVTVNWTVEGVNASDDFMWTKGTIFFSEVRAV